MYTGILNRLLYTVMTYPLTSRHLLREIRDRDNTNNVDYTSTPGGSQIQRLIYVSEGVMG